MHPTRLPRLTAALLGAMLLLPAPAAAKAWQGVDPGKTTCEDVAARLGEPAQRVNRGAATVLLYKEDTQLPGAKTAQFHCRGDGVVEVIEVFVATALGGEEIEGTYGKPELKTFDTAFNKVWQYPAQGVAVYFDKDGNVKAIQFSLAKKGKPAAPAAEKADAKGEKAP
jgi:hypothetical protein